MDEVPANKPERFLYCALMSAKAPNYTLHRLPVVPKMLLI